MSPTLRRCTLQPHPQAKADAVQSVSCEVAWDDVGRWTFDFSVAAPPGALLLPATQAPVRTAGLWRTTCFEIFLQRAGHDDYHEYNFSPSTRWAAYRFDGFRRNSVDLEVNPPRVEPSLTADAVYRVRASSDGQAFAAPGPWRVGITAVIEETNGMISYWALAHPAAKPDFHLAESFVLELP